ncbi:MAG: hypothetical protein A2381_14480 [Bdellovibrionales bacterium RIFOXYB1_FULL_37_110]|nr:MAG: hypothetical protein A2417_03140 [Bdellovibrionales bacterium RIFOXYC1_FULL_37_79]OFZ58346.1 MAG: hypothetical protein A2381_14480 [Bdellovibrionales bacterium RIFOXYB1_FULL_37_110]OFZ62684.1 MAG: hypothetical protein A2577_02190 [Bdellovibrionales bacterium RIFOXYD1_FULL_36_51]
MKIMTLTLAVSFFILVAYSQVPTLPLDPQIDGETQKLIKEYQEKYKVKKTPPKTKVPTKKFYTNQELKERKLQREMNTKKFEFSRENFEKYQKEITILDTAAKKHEEECQKEKEIPCQKTLEIQQQKIKLLCKYKVVENACEIEKHYEDQRKKNEQNMQNAKKKQDD